MNARRRQRNLKLWIGAILTVSAIAGLSLWDKSFNSQTAIIAKNEVKRARDAFTVPPDVTKRRGRHEGPDSVAGSHRDGDASDEGEAIAKTKGPAAGRPTGAAEKKKPNTTTKGNEFLSLKSPGTTSTPYSALPTSPTSEALYYRLRPTKVNPLRYQVLFSEESLCSGWDDTPFPRVLILVISDPSHKNERAAIRKTWASGLPPYRSPHTKVMFVVGESSDDLREQVRHEHAESRDVLQLDVPDTYQTITAKILAALHWSVRFCSSADYIFKTDDDIFVNVQSLAKTVGNFSRTNVVFGVDIGYAPVRRQGKWALSVQQYPFDRLPLYLSGCGYGMSVDAADRLVSTSEYVPQLPIEDLYITGILARVANVSLQPSHAFPTWLSQTPEDACMVLRGRMVALHGVPVKRMTKLWWKVTNGFQDHCSFM